MAWNDQEPRGNRGNRNEGPPDLEEMLKRFSDWLRGLFGGKPGRPAGRSGNNSGGFGGLLLGAGVLVLIWAAFDSFHVIDARQEGVVLRFGKFSRTLSPGPQFTFPRPIEQVITVEVTQVKSIDSKARMLTSDENLVDIFFAVQYRVSDARDYLFKVKEPDATLSQSSESVVRQVIGSRALDEILVGNRAAMAEEARELIQKLLDMYGAGLTVIAVNFQNVAPPTDVKEAFDDAIKAREDAPRSINDAEAYASKVVPEAKGQAARVLQQAEAYKQSAVARATGDARRFELLAEQYQAAPEVTRRRLYLETMQEVLRRVPKVLVDGQSGNGGGPMLYLPLDKLAPRPNAPGSMTVTPEGTQ